MIQILAASSAGTCNFIGDVKFKADKDDPEGFVATARMRFEIADGADADAWERVFPGFRARYDLACEKDSGRMWPADRAAHPLELVFSGARQKGGGATEGGLEDIAATVTKCVAKLTHKAQHVDVSLRLPGVSEADTAGVVRLLRGRIHVETTNAQGDLFEGQGSTGNGVGLPPEKGSQPVA